MRFLLTVIAVVAVLASGCGGDGSATAEPSDRAQSSAPAEPSNSTVSPRPTAASPRASAASSAAPRGTTLKLGDSQFGRVLFDGSGQAIYLFAKERTTTPECYGECAEAWPPVLTNGPPAAGRGTDNALLGTTERTNGSTQVTYAGHPLYFYAHEGKNEVKCHNFNEFGGLWLALTATGEAAPH